MSIRRIGWGVVAQAYNQGVTVLLQLVTTPLLIAAWGATEYGNWIVVSALPAYLVLLDLGFSQIAANDMSAKIAHGDHVGARRTFESLVAIFLTVILPILVLCAVLAYALPIERFVKEEAASFHVHRTAVIALIGYVAAAILSSVVSAALRAEGLFSLMITLNTTSRLLEGFAIVAAAKLLDAGIEGAAAAMLVVRMLATAAMIVVLYSRSSLLRLRVEHGELAEARRLLWPSLMYLGFPLGNALSLQGVLIVIGIFLSPVAVTIYATSRTLARLGVNTLGAINHVFVFEYAVRIRDTRRLTRIGLAHFALEAAGTLFFFGFLWFFGGAVYQFWLGGKVAFVRELFLIVVFQSTLEVTWAACITPLIAWNRHTGIAMAYVLGASAAILAVAGILAHGGTVENSALVLAALFGVLSVDAMIRLRRVLATPSLAPYPVEKGHVS